MKMSWLLLIGISSSAFGAAPLCVNVGTRSEGWVMKDGSLRFDTCSKKVVYCGNMGEANEGWQSALALEMRQLGYANCSEYTGTRPSCVNVGTRSEGWATPTGRILYDQCAEKVAVCSAVGTRSEGWFAAALDKSTVQTLSTENCSSVE